MLGITYCVSAQMEQVMNVYKQLKVLDSALAEKLFEKAILP